MKRFIMVCFVSFLSFGCGTPSHLVYVHGTTVGLDVSAGTEGTGRFVLGYDRDTYSIIPRKSNHSKIESDAMSLAAVSCVFAEGLDDVQFKHFVSTGVAAIQVAQEPEVLAQINQSIQGRGERCAAKVNSLEDTEIQEETENTIHGGN